MNKMGINDISYNQFSKIIIGATVGVGALSLPNDLAIICKQDAWISAIIGGWYPLLITILGVYISSKHPKESIFTLSKKYFGKIMGGTLFLVFISQFFIYIVTVTSGFSNILRVYIVEFLNPYKTIGIILLLSALGCIKGLNVIGRINELTYYFMLLLLIIPFIVFNHGSYLNISPILGSGIYKILEGTKQSGFAYAGVEILLLIYPFINDSKKEKYLAFKAVAIIIGIYTWFTFTTIYFLSPEIAEKANWSFMIMTESIQVPFINNFRLVFMFLWSLIIFKTAIDNYYAVGFSLNQYIKKVSINKFNFMLLPIIFYVTLKYGNEAKRKGLIKLFRPRYVYFNIIYLAILALLIFFNRGKNHEKQKIS